jgi:hypothetical protein
MAVTGNLSNVSCKIKNQKEKLRRVSWEFGVGQDQTSILMRKLHPKVTSRTIRKVVKVHSLWSIEPLDLLSDLIFSHPPTQKASLKKGVDIRRVTYGCFWRSFERFHGSSKCMLARNHRSIKRRRSQEYRGGPHILRRVRSWSWKWAVWPHDCKNRFLQKAITAWWSSCISFFCEDWFFSTMVHLCTTRVFFREGQFGDWFLRDTLKL